MQENAVEFSLHFTYSEEEKPALKAVEGTIPRGKCVVLCGSSGCGKSTLLRCFNHLIPQFYEGELKGFCRIAGKDLEGLTIGETGQLAASVFQDPRSQFFTLNSDTEAAFGLENFGWPREKMVPRVEEAFHTFHMEHLRSRNVFALSSGERQLVAILSAWAMDTELLLLDEPTANLDYAAVQQLTDTLKILKRKGKTLVISEHRLYYLRDVADEYWLIENGEIREKIPADRMRSMDRETLGRMGLRTLDLQQVRGALQPAARPIKEDCLEVRDLHFRYHTGGREVLRGVSLEAHTGEVVGLLGHNGCGKTTLGKQLAGLMEPASGEISLNGKTLRGKSLSDSSIFIMQEAEFQFFTNSVINELSYGMQDADSRRGEIEELLRFAGLWECRNRHPFSLSGGQMQKLVMLLACLSDKPVVILDEPTAGLDYKSLEVCAQLIRRLQKEHIVFLISHDLELMSMVCTRSIRITEGRVGEQLDLTAEGRFEALRQQMENEPLPHGGNAETEKPKRRLDPRLKLLIIAAAMIGGIGTDLSLILSLLSVIVIAALWERKPGLVLGIVGSMALVNGLYWFFPNVATSFIASFFPRMILIGAGAGLAASPDEGPRILAGIRALHIPERVNMIVSVVFRFFPVLHSDLKIMKQAIATRGFFQSFGQKLRSAPEYLEIVIVPMVFRVLRIAEALSASAETRGIAMKGKRESFTAISWTGTDTLMTVLLAAAAAAGMIMEV